MNEAPDMSPEAIDRRLRKQSDLLELCLRLRKEITVTPPPSDTEVQSPEPSTSDE